MSATSAHELTTSSDCKAYGCTNAAQPNGPTRGPYAGLCEEHNEAQRRRFSAIHRGEDPGPPLTAAPDAQNGNGHTPIARTKQKGYAARAKALVALGRDVDLAIARAERSAKACEPTIRRAREAKAAAEALAEQFRAAVRELAT